MSQGVTPVYLRLVLTTACWGGTFIAGRHLAQALPLFVAAAGRYLAAVALLAAWAWWRDGRLPRLSGAQHAWTCGLGASGVALYNACFFAGLELIPASRAALIIAANPILTLLATQVMRPSRWPRSRLSGVALSFLGAAVVISHGRLSELGTAVSAGELWIFGAVLSWVAYTLLAQRALKRIDAFAATFWSSVWGMLMLMLPAIPELIQGPPPQLDGLDLLAIAYMGLFGTALAFIWFSQGVAALGPARAAQFTNLVPVFAVLFSIVLLGEPPAWSGVFGGALVVGGVWLVNRRRDG